MNLSNLFRNSATAIPALVAAILGLGGTEATADGTRKVVINGLRIDDEKVAALEQAYRVGVVDGDYWYDKATGAWGARGGPTAGFVLPGLDLGGPLQAEASGGGTGVFVNGRELHPIDLAGLRQLVGAVYPGRYWIDAYGNCGYEGGPVLVNLLQLAQRNGAGTGGPWSHHPSTGGHVGGDGQGFYYSIDKDTSYSSGP